MPGIKLGENDKANSRSLVVQKADSLGMTDFKGEERAGRGSVFSEGGMPGIKLRAIKGGNLKRAGETPALRKSDGRPPLRDLSSELVVW